MSSPLKVLLDGPEEFWLPAMETLEEELGWEPVYWMVKPETEEAVARRYPGCIRHDVFRAVKGLPASDARITPLPLDQELLREYSYEQALVLDMMSRLDADQRLGYRSRVHLFQDQLSYWLGVISECRPDIAVFSESPHSVFDYVLYAVCKRAGIKTVLFERWTMEGQIFALERLEEGSREIRDRYEERLEGLPARPPGLSEVAAAHLDRLRGNYGAARPHYMVPQQQVFQRITQRRWLSRARSALVSLLDLMRPSAVKRRLEWLAQSEPTYDVLNDEVGQVEVQNRRLLHRHVAARTRKRRLRKRYEALAANSVDVDLTGPYVYCALHYQPERTTSPNGEIFADQLLMLRLLAATLPAGWRLLVKDHITQFLPNFKGERGRDPGFYDRIATLPNTQLLPLSFPSFDLIDHARAVATVTGTVGWEAVVRGKPALVFGHAWYRDCHGVHYTPTRELLERALGIIQAGEPIEADKVDLFAEVVEASSSSRAYIGNIRNGQALGITPEESAEAHVEAVKRLLDYAGVQE